MSDEIYAQVGENSYISFPKGTPNDVIQSAVQRYHAQQAFQPTQDEDTPSLGGAVLRAGVRSAFPVVAGIFGGGAGTVAAGPVGTVAGGVGASMAAAELQEKFLESHPKIAEALGQSPEQIAADIKAHPTATTLTELGTSLIGNRWEGKTLKALAGVGEKAAVSAARKQALVNAGLAGGIDTALQLTSNQPFNPVEALGATALGATTTKQTRLGEALHEAGEATANKVAKAIRPRAQASIETPVEAANVYAGPDTETTPRRPITEPTDEPTPTVDPSRLVNQRITESVEPQPVVKEETEEPISARTREERIGDIYSQAEEYFQPSEEDQRTSEDNITVRDNDEAIRRINTMALDEKDKVDKRGVFNKLVNWGKNTWDEGYDELVRKFQTSARPLYRLQQSLQYLGKLVVGNNDIYNAATLNPSAYEIHSVNKLIGDQNTAAQALFDKLGVSWDKGLATLKAIMIGLNDPDLRTYHYAINVPLSEQPVTLPNGVTMSPADMRDIIVQAIKSGKDLTSPDAVTKYGYDAKSLRDQLDYLVQNYKDPQGRTPNARVEAVGKPLDFQDSVYDVSGPFSQKTLQIFRNLHDEIKSAHPEELQAVFDANQALRDKVIQLDRLTNHFGQHVDNAIAFQNREHYFTLKGSNVDDSISNPHLGTVAKGDLTAVQQAQDGRVTMSDNPFTQTAADAMVALNRLDRQPLLDALYNNITQKNIKGRILPPIKIDEREYGLNGLNPKNIVLRPREDGKMDVMYIQDPDFAEAVKGVITTQSKRMEVLGDATRFITAGLTRYNPTFAIPNAIRHFATNMGNISAELGPTWGARLVAHTLSELAQGSIFKSAKAASLIANDDTATLSRLAQNDDYYKNIEDWIKTGGKITQGMAYSNEAATNQLVDSLKKKGIYGWLQSAGNGLEHVAEVWNNMFEFLNREAAFSTFKNHGLSQGMSEEQATRYAAAQAKNMLNLQQTAQYTKDMNSYFALFKAEATGAVRQTDALLSPLFNSAEDYFNKYIKGTPLETKYFRRGAANEETTQANLQEFIDSYNRHRRNALISLMASTGFGYMAYNMSRASSPIDEDGNNVVAGDDKGMWVRNIRIPMSILGKNETNDKYFINVPIGFGTGAFASIGAQLAALQHRDQTLSEAAMNIGEASKQSFLPIPSESVELFRKNPAGWAIDSVLPSVLRPVASLAMNLDEFARQLHPSTAGKYGEAYTGGDFTPEMYKDAAEYIQDKTGSDERISPQTLQFLANNYMQGVANIAQSLYGDIETARGIRKADLKTDVLPLSGLVGRAADVETSRYTKNSVELQKLEEKITTMQNTENYDELDRFLDKHPDAVGMMETYKKLKRDMNVIQAQINRARATSETPKERQEDIDDLRKIKTLYMKTINDAYSEYKENN